MEHTLAQITSSAEIKIAASENPNQLIEYCKTKYNATPTFVLPKLDNISGLENKKIYLIGFKTV